MKKVLSPPVIKRTQKDYSMSFKLQVVAEYEQSELGITALAQKYGIQSPGTIRRWIKKFSIFDKQYKVTIMKEKSPEQKLFALEQQVRLLERQKKTLEKELNHRDQKCIMFDAIVEVVKEEYDIDLSKKDFPNQLKDTSTKEEKA